MLATVLERETRSRQQLVCRARYVDLTGPGERHDARGDVDDQAADIPGSQLHLFGVYPRAQAEAEIPGMEDGRLRRPDGALRGCRTGRGSPRPST